MATIPVYLPDGTVVGEVGDYDITPTGIVVSIRFSNDRVSELFRKDIIGLSVISLTDEATEKIQEIQNKQGEQTDEQIH